MVLSPTAVGLGASASWNEIGCFGSELNCYALPEGSHSADVGEAPATGTLEVDGVTEATCSIGATGGDCDTRGTSKQDNDCHTAVAITDGLDEVADDSADWGDCGGDDGESDLLDIIDDESP